jgi:predicted ABC-type ATPase
MKFRDFLEEQKEVHHVMAFGRMSPPTTGHEVLVNKVKDVAKSVGGSHSVVLSHTQDKDKNPLSSADKVKHAKRFFPKTNISTSSRESPTFLSHAAELHKQGVTHLHMVAGSDRVPEYKKKLAQYNGPGEGKLYNFKKITVHSAGERDPDAEGTAGMSASKMRGHAAAGNFKEFKKGVPAHVPEHHAKEMYNDVRRGMKTNESINEEFEYLLFEGVHDKAIFKAVFLAGGPGSGKDYVLDNTLAGHGMTEINSDKALEFLMDKEKLDKRMPDDEQEQRNAVREKAKTMTELRQRLALQGRNGLIINGTGDDYDKIKRIKEKLEALGYETSMMMVNTADEISKTRNVERGQRGGRTVPEDKRKEKWDAAQKSRPQFAELFKDSYVEFDNSEDLRSSHPDTVKGKKDEMLSLFKNFQKFVSKPPKNDVAKQWVASQLGKKDTLPTKDMGDETMHPSDKDSKATQQAKQLGLSYFGFGRWGKGGTITHHVVHGSLVANEKEKRAQTVVQVPQTKTIEKIKKVNEEFEDLLNETVDLHHSKLMKDGKGKVRTFMLRRNAAKEAHIHNGVVHRAEKGYVIKIKENEDVKSTSQFFKNENEIGRISESGSSTRTNTGASGESGRSFYEETGPRKKITLTEIRSRQKEINEIDAGIEPGLSMASSGENFSRGLDRSMVTSGVKYNRDSKKKTIKELTGDETTMSTGDKKEDELKKVGINLSSFKAKKFVG